ncbi:MAG: Maf family protein [Burkholderiales bacterium]|nr:Maf family protein [Burkholderiales bacterium]
MSPVHLILASTSPYRQALLERFNLPFSVCAPEIDETPLPGETPSQLVLRLSEAKARAVAQQVGAVLSEALTLHSLSPLPPSQPSSKGGRSPIPSPSGGGLGWGLAVQECAPLNQKRSDDSPRVLIIGGDQVADSGGVAVGKPGNFDNARKQLRTLSGKTVIFRTGLALFNPQAGRCRSVRVDIATTYRVLTDAEIEAYLHAVQPYNCAGAVRSEDLGIALFERIDNDDPTALIGLPLIALARLLRAEGVNPLLHQPPLISHSAP